MGQASETQVYAGYRQFYVMDADSPGDTGSVAFWTEEAFASRLPVEAGVVGVATDTYGEVPVTLEVLGAEPQMSPDDWDHVAEASLLVSAGRITLMGCPDEPTGLVVTVAPGRYRVRVCFAGLTSEPDEADYNGDSYLVQVWPSDLEGRRVVKHFGGEVGVWQTGPAGWQQRLRHRAGPKPGPRERIVLMTRWEETSMGRHIGRGLLELLPALPAFAFAPAFRRWHMR